MRIPGNVPTGHVDCFAQRLLPPRDLWPEFDYSAPHLSHFPDAINAASLIDRAIEQGLGDLPVYYYGDDVWTFRHLKDRAERIARLLVEDFKLVPGNRVLLRAANNPMLAACWLGVLKAGGICVTTMPLLRAKELAFILDRVQVRFALCGEDLVDELEAALPGSPVERWAAFSPLGEGGGKRADFDRLVDAKPAGFGMVRTAADDIALICFTSGTTGNPKAAAHFHRDILAIAECYPQVFTVTRDDVICGTPSIAFSFGLGGFIAFPLRHGARVAFVPKPSPEALLKTIETRRVTSLYAVPTAYNALLDLADKYDISSLKKCSSAGEALQMSLFRRFRERTGIALVNGIGSTEMLNHFLSDTLDVERPGSTGRAVPGYTVRLLGDDGEILPPGTRGRLAVKGPTGCKYLDDEDRQAVYVQNGWNVTGDLFEQDELGCFWFVDRADDLIISAGYNISPQEIEQAVMQHPGIKECAVVGEPDEERGKLVCACVVLNDPAAAGDAFVAELQDFVKARVAPYKYPRRVRFFDALPRTETGKIQRFRLRQPA